MTSPDEAVWQNSHLESQKQMRSNRAETRPSVKAHCNNTWKRTKARTWHIWNVLGEIWWLRNAFPWLHDQVGRRLAVGDRTGMRPRSARPWQVVHSGTGEFPTDQPWWSVTLPKQRDREREREKQRERKRERERERERETRREKERERERQTEVKASVAKKSQWWKGSGMLQFQVKR